MCSIGKSVNLLRTHRNVEIQKKARSLVDTWKKRVQVELDAKYGPNQSVPWSDVAKCGIKHYRPSEVAVKSSVTQFSATKTGFVKLVQGGTASKSASATPVPTKASTLPASARTKARNATIVGTSDPQTTTRDEKINSSSQSHNNTLSQVAHHGTGNSLMVCRGHWGFKVKPDHATILCTEILLLEKYHSPV
ncbi:hypothetical protein Gotur_029624 [Gossypium turneri]